jgi:hypothetical protein
MEKSISSTLHVQLRIPYPVVPLLTQCTKPLPTFTGMNVYRRSPNSPIHSLSGHIIPSRLIPVPIDGNSSRAERMAAWIDPHSHPHPHLRILYVRCREFSVVRRCQKFLKRLDSWIESLALMITVTIQLLGGRVVV